MPEVVFYREDDGSVPALDWLAALPTKAKIMGVARVELLAERGHMLRRPHAEHLRDGIHELRFKRQNVNYRLFYFFHGTRIVVLSHGITKQQAEVPAIELERAILRSKKFATDPVAHSYREA